MIATYIFHGNDKTLQSINNTIKSFNTFTTILENLGWTHQSEPYGEVFYSEKGRAGHTYVLMCARTTQDDQDAFIKSLRELFSNDKDFAIETPNQ